MTGKTGPFIGFNEHIVCLSMIFDHEVNPEDTSFVSFCSNNCANGSLIVPVFRSPHTAASSMQAGRFSDEILGVRIPSDIKIAALSP
ncbi:hypothetical protein [uncultured Cohaesibacter sp.]|uniref:hypothetical protein n=1 Tax=uncultured Cohaesibacter sp. TaxID=1002546 RepID=UPI00292F8B75|nr:hypothetical protein [uncultured Cohaesibacter sp.]